MGAEARGGRCRGGGGARSLGSVSEVPRASAGVGDPSGRGEACLATDAGASAGAGGRSRGGSSRGSSAGAAPPSELSAPRLRRSASESACCFSASLSSFSAVSRCSTPRTPSPTHEESGSDERSGSVGPPPPAENRTAAARASGTSPAARADGAAGGAAGVCAGCGVEDGGGEADVAACRWPGAGAVSASARASRRASRSEIFRSCTSAPSFSTPPPTDRTHPGTSPSSAAPREPRIATRSRSAKLLGGGGGSSASLSASASASMTGPSNVAAGRTALTTPSPRTAAHAWMLRPTSRASPEATKFWSRSRAAAAPLAAASLAPCVSSSAARARWTLASSSSAARTLACAASNFALARRCAASTGAREPRGERFGRRRFPACAGARRRHSAMRMRQESRRRQRHEIGSIHTCGMNVIAKKRKAQRL